MNGWLIVGVGILFAAFILLPRMGWIGLDKAKGLLGSGAVLVDVRSPGEFRNGSVKGAVNMPLQEIVSRVQTAKFPPDQVILLYCASGTRSGMAKRQLEKAGYTAVHNLGSFGRASHLEN